MKKLLLFFMPFQLVAVQFVFATDWTNASIYNFKVFIENKGQFSHNENFLIDPIEYATNVNGVQIYFTKKGLTYRYDELKNADASAINNQEKERMFKSIPHFVHMDWVGANRNVELLYEDKVSYYFTYPNTNDISGRTGLKANAYKKIIYKNIYENIDVEYFFPENKEGMKYNIILHPGADASLIKMNYSHLEKTIVDEDGNIQLILSIGTITDHAPVTYNAIDNSPILSFYELNENVVSFHLANYDKSQTVIIDPWTTVPTFTSYNSAYDVEYDNYGNVYVYGGNGQSVATPFQEIKLNSSGVIQWVYSATTFNVGAPQTNYGDFAVDATSGSSYLTEGYGISGSATAIKLNSAGAQIALYPGDPRLQEMWRIEFNNCTKKAVVGGGGTDSVFQASIFDTNLVSMTPINILGLASSEPYHDISLLAMDNSGNYFMAPAEASTNPLLFNNTLVKGPVINSMLPLAYAVPDNHSFQESRSIPYINNHAPIGASFSLTNGFNGMAANSLHAYTYDGKLVQRWNKNTGALINSTSISAIRYRWGGITVDECDNIFVGLVNSVVQLDINFNTINTIPTADTVYDVLLAPGNMLNVCGKSFVSAVANGVTCNVLTANVTLSNPCTNASATVTVTGGAPNYSYVWSPSGGTGTTISGVPSGTYTVTVSDNACNTTTATIIYSSSTAITATIATVQPGCVSNFGSAIVAVTGGTPGYTYLWSPSGGTTANASGLNAGTYTVTVTDLNGCTQTATTTLNAVSNTLALTTSSSPSVCTNNNGTVSVVVTGGTPTYSYLWLPGGATTSSINGLASGTYTVIVTDINGCTQTATTTIIFSSETLTVTATTTPSICTNNDGTATVAITGGTAGFTYLWSPGGGTTNTINALAPGTYTVTVTDANSCSQTATATVILSSGTLAVSATATPALCTNNNGTATATITGGTAGFTYLWSPGGGTTNTINGLAPGTYTVTVTDANSCSQTATATVILSSGTLAVSATTTPDFCSNNSGTATATITGGTAGYTYLWSPSGGTNSTAVGLSGGTYTVMVTDINGCSQTSTALVTSTIGPAAGVSNNVTIQIGSSTTLNASGGVSYAWSPATGLNCTNCQSPVAKPFTTTTYCVEVTDNNGCTDTACVTVVVDIPCPTNEQLNVPNAFSPNNDNINDEFCLQGWSVCIEKFEILIYDRWGEKVFESTQPDFCWDGKYLNRLMDAQVFVYAINASFFNKDEKIVRKGNISLIR